MNGTTSIRETPVKPYSRSGNPQERIPAAGSPPTAGHTPEGVGFAAATALSLFARGIPQKRNPALRIPACGGAHP